MRDPYAIYAKNVLGLYPLDPLDLPMGGREYGLAVHAALEHIDDSSTARMAKLLKQELIKAGYEAHSFARMDVRIQIIAEWASDWAAMRKQQGWQAVGIEKKGRLEMETSGEPFILTGIADRIERKGSDTAIIDFKTGAYSKYKVVQAGFDPQMPLLGLMLASGKLGKTADPSDYIYVKPGESGYSLVTNTPAKYRQDADEYAHNAYDAVQKLIAHFDQADSRYYSQPRAQYENPYGDYDQLARRAEWATLEDDA